MRYQDKIKTSLFIGMLAMAMLTGGCQSQDNGRGDTATATRMPTRSDLIREGKIKVKEKADTDEGTDSNPEVAPPSESIQQAEGPDVTTIVPDTSTTDTQQQNLDHYILNTNTKLFHIPSCEKVAYIAPHNYSEFDGTRDELIGQGYSACYTCNP